MRIVPTTTSLYARQMHSTPVNIDATDATTAGKQERYVHGKRIPGTHLTSAFSAEASMDDLYRNHLPAAPAPPPASETMASSSSTAPVRATIDKAMSGQLADVNPTPENEAIGKKGLGEAWKDRR